MAATTRKGKKTMRRKLALNLIAIGMLLLCLIIPAQAATITAAKAGNFSDPTVWNGGAVPGNGDIADLNGYVVAMDIATIPASGTLLALTAAGNAGQLTVSSSLGNAVINATTITAGTVGNTGFIAYSGTTGTGLTINCTNFYGCASGGTSPRGLQKTSTKNLTINGNVTGGGVASATCIYINASGVHTINGNVTGGSASSAYGISFNYGTLNITGITSGGSGGTAFGVGQSGGGTTMNITGNVVGGSGTNACGLSITSSNTLTLNSCNLINGIGGVALSGVPPSTWNLTAANYQQWGSVKFAQELLPGQILSGVVNGDVTGTLAPFTRGGNLNGGLN